MDYYIIVPGLGGSRIYCGCNGKRSLLKLYPSLRSFGKHFFDRSCASIVKPLKSVFGVSIYRQLENRLGKNKCIFFPYDWRWNTPLEAAKNLYQFIKKMERRSVTLIGHSNGGFIIRILLEYLSFPRNEIDKIFICGTPFFGSMNECLYKTEYNLYFKLIDPTVSIRIKPLLLSTKDINNIFKHCRSALVYFVPSCIFQKYTNAELASEFSVPEHELSIVKTIHMRLSKFKFERYTFYFNISYNDSITTTYPSQMPMFNYIIPTATSMTQHKNGTVQVTRKIKTDSLVVPSLEFPRNSVVLFDDFPLSHSLIMNSRFLSTYICKGDSVK